MFEYSVIIPAFNAQATLAEAISSIQAQSVQPREIIVVDDGSLDNTSDIAMSFNVKLFQQDNRGPGAACNRGLDFVETQFVAFLDADDIWLPNKIERQAEYLKLNPDLSGLFCKLQHFFHGDPQRQAGRVQEGWGRTSLLIRADDMRKIGPIYDPPEGGRGDMIDWIARARELKYSFFLIPEVLALRRIIAGSLSYGRDDRDRGYLDVVRRALERKRLSPGRLKL